MLGTAELTFAAGEARAFPEQGDAENRGRGRWSAKGNGGVADEQVCLDVKLVQNHESILYRDPLMQSISPLFLLVYSY